MPTVTFNRISEYENRFRKIRLEVNGKLFTKINNGEIKKLELPYGKHYFQAKIDWCTSNILEVELIEDIDIKLMKGKGSTLYRTTFGYKKYLLLQLEVN
ncbi:hypothetical protein [Mesoflavibacter profundi]|uniref:hypothetical protein n=1 Tax=Mesoflavibacter profundi TaxID=2708110 RepID=UPI00168AA401|nr:hypothetical protein [Mesoflavibacter profundi]